LVGPPLLIMEVVERFKESLPRCGEDERSMDEVRHLLEIVMIRERPTTPDGGGRSEDSKYPRGHHSGFWRLVSALERVEVEEGTRRCV
jgi:hypothetical protein